MDIVKTFNEYSINIQGSINEPLFSIDQIGKVLELKNIKAIVKKFDNDEKTENKFLTEVGLLKLLGMSKKPIVNPFRKWIVNTIKDIRITKIKKSTNLVSIKELEVEKIRIQQKQLELFQKEIELEIEKNKYLELNKIEAQIALQELESTEFTFPIRKRNPSSRTPKVYQYNPNDLTKPIKEYDSPMEVERAFVDISPASLKRAYKNNTIYKNHRWLFTNRTEELPQCIPETVELKHAPTEVKFLAMIDIKKTKIMEVFSSQKDACEARNLKSHGFTRAIKDNTVSSGHYWKFFDDCSPEMKYEYLSRASLPEKYIQKNGSQVQQIDPKTNEVIITHNSNRTVIKKFQMSIATLKKVSDSGDIYNGYKWKIIQ